MTHKLSFSTHKGNWFQDPHGYQNLWMLKSLICNSVEQYIKLAHCTHRFQRRGSKILLNLQLVDSAKPGDMEGLLCNYWEKNWYRNGHIIQTCFVQGSTVLWDGYIWIWASWYFIIVITLIYRFLQICIWYINIITKSHVLNFILGTSQ